MEHGAGAMKYLLKQKNPDVDEKTAIGLSRALNIGVVLARILCARGICTPAAAKLFLHPDKGQLNDPLLFTDMADSVSLVRHTIAAGGRMLIYGDYDVDGTAGCAIMFHTLKKLGANVECMLPSRMEHGYGLSLEAVEQMAGYDLLITVDCGITNVAEIDRARELGLRSIIADHHECGAALPKADYIINAKREGERYPYKDLCGAGVAFKFAVALAGEAAYEYIDLAAIATVADIVPLTGENRVIAKLGLDKLNSQPNPGIKWLVKKAGVKSRVINSQTVAYSLAPRINAAGRIASARVAFDLMTEQDETRLEKLTEELCSLNADRQARQEQMYRQVLEMEEEMDSGRLVLLYNEGWDAGIIGLAASKVAERYSKPAILFGKVGDMYVGSARSIDGVNIYEALATQKDLYEKFGGHAGAAGLTIDEKHLETLKQRMELFLDNKYGDEVFTPVKYYDAELHPREIDKKLLAELELLRPFGHKNELVDILVRGARLTEVKPIAEGKHTRFMIEKNGGKINAVMFGKTVADIPAQSDVVGVARMNTFDNLPQMVVETLSTSEITYAEYEAAREKLASGAVLQEAFLTREKLLEVYTVLRGVSEKKPRLADMRELFALMTRYVDGLSAARVAFAILVLEQIQLLEIKKNGKISVVTRSGKRKLEDSELYKRLSDVEY